MSTTDSETTRAALAHDWQPVGNGTYRLDRYSVSALPDGSRFSDGTRSTRGSDAEGAAFVSEKSRDPNVSLRRWADFAWADAGEGPLMLRVEPHRGGLAVIAAIPEETDVLPAVRWDDDAQLLIVESAISADGRSNGFGGRLAEEQVRGLLERASVALRAKTDRRGYRHP